MLDLGFTHNEIRSLIDRGHLVRVRRGVVRLAGVPPAWTQTVRAATMAAPDGSFASHWTAARLWEAPFVEWRDGIDLLREGVNGVRQKGVRSHTTLLLPESHRRVRHGIPVTSLERTLVDLCGALPPGFIEEVADELRRQRRLRIPRLRDASLNVPPSGRRAIRPMLDYLASYRASIDPGANRRELDVLQVLCAAGIHPLPVQQHRVVVDGREYFLDYAWPEIQNALEFMGFNPHGSLVSRFHRDADRLRDLQRAGWRVWPITDRTSEEEVIELALTIVALVDAA